MKWGDWWALGCVAVAIVVGATTSIDAAVLIFVAAALGIPINALQRRVQSRPCPRCGRRVGVGELDCPACKFDFRVI